MRRHHLLSRPVALLATFLLACVAAPWPRLAGAQGGCTTCTPPPQLGRQDTWPQNTLVTVNISSSFTAEQRGCIEQAFRNWQNAGTHAGVVYQFTYGGPNISGTPGSVQVWRETPPTDPNGDQPQADTTTNYNAAGTNVESAIMRFHPGVTNCTALQEAVAHEVGHLYGLDDCLTCCDGTSTMTGYNSLNDIHTGMVSPSSCDVAAATQAGQYDPATENPPATGGAGGGGGDGGGSGGGGGGGGGGCTEYWWVQYECDSEEGRLPRRGYIVNAGYRPFGVRRSPLAPPFMECREVNRWYAGCY
jgi:uncharacterized membrane protein YgcG